MKGFALETASLRLHPVPVYPNGPALRWNRYWLGSMLVIAALGLSLTSYGQQQAQPLAPTLDQHRPATAAPTQPAPQATPAPAQGVTPSPNPSYNPTYNPVFKPGYQRPITNQYGRPLGQGQPIRQWVQGESVPNAQNIIIILDASESMNDEINGVPKMTLAKQAIMQTLGNLPPNVRVGLRVYGHQVVSRGLFSSGGKNCQQTELIIPLGFNNRQKSASGCSPFRPWHDPHLAGPDALCLPGFL
ncbi:MAG: hypothetical protein R2857_04410 [Vampirovibrionales bacterium]